MGLLLLLIPILTQQIFAQNLPSCDSKVYCQGDLLHTVQMARIFNDSKTFVDMKMKNPENTTLQNFNTFIDSNPNPTKDEIKQFVDNHFETAHEFEDWIPSDYTQTPKILSQIEDPEIRNFTQNLINIWPKLARKVKQEVLENSDLYTLLGVENGFIIPGGRFKEFYYWDSYWIIKGLLVSEMHETVRGMLENFFLIIEKHGFLPNGARIYYLNRSQPPLLSLMVATYIEATNDTTWLKSHIDTLDKELQFWLNKKLTVVHKNGVKYTLAHYDSESGSPRPESYYEDYTTASYLPNENDKIQLWADLKSGAESGWDFSSRWIVDENGGTNANLSHLQTRRIIPVDLNSFLCQAFKKIAEMYVIIGDYQKAIYWFEKFELWKKTIKQVHYNETDGIWYDYDNVLEQHRAYFFPSNFAPLWAEAYDSHEAEILGKKAAEYFIAKNVMDYPGGIPASLSDTREQWDYPNAWPPLQSIVILGLDKTGNCKAKGIASEFANRWVSANMKGYNETNEMFEKYDAVNPGQYGGGGEYVVQSGFGWTNGVILEFVERFFATKKQF